MTTGLTAQAMSTVYCDAFPETFANALTAVQNEGNGIHNWLFGTTWPVHEWSPDGSSRPEAN